MTSCYRNVWWEIRYWKFIKICRKGTSKIEPKKNNHFVKSHDVIFERPLYQFKNSFLCLFLFFLSTFHRISKPWPNLNSSTLKKGMNGWFHLQVSELNHFHCRQRRVFSYWILRTYSRFDDNLIFLLDDEVSQ